jgi:RNA recognition motif-containing protein
MNIFVGRLSYETQEKDLRTLFEGVGQVKSLKIITDRETGKSKGFAFVTMANSADGAKAIQHLHGASIDGRNISVTEAEDRRSGDKKPAPSGGEFKPRREEPRSFDRSSSDENPRIKPEADSDGWTPAPMKEAPSRKNSPNKTKEKARGKGDEDGFRKKKLAPLPKSKKNRGWEDDLDDFGDFNYS